MYHRNRQSGLTLLGFIFVLGLVGFFLFIGMKLFPVYQEYYAVVTAMKGIQQEPGVAEMSPTTIRGLHDRRFSVGYVESVKPENIKITRDNGYNLTIKYEVRRPLVSNLDYVAKFDKTVALDRKGGVD